jgi:hypothetical protein
MPNHSYRATTIPKGVSADEVEIQSDQGLLPTIQIRAINAGIAAIAAMTLTGRPVLKVERIEVA